MDKSILKLSPFAGNQVWDSVKEVSGGEFWLALFKEEGARNFVW